MSTQEIYWDCKARPLRDSTSSFEGGSAEEGTAFETPLGTQDTAEIILRHHNTS